MIRTPHVRPFLALAAAVSMLLAMIAVCALGSPASAGVDVVGDDEADRYVGIGGLVLPGTVPDQDRTRVAACADCRWRLTDPCVTDGGACDSVTRGCAAGRQLLRAWISHDAGSTWEELGLVCIAPSGPVTVAGVGREIHEDFEQALPKGGVRYQPPRGVLPYLPVVFHSGQPAGIPPIEVVVAGYRVVVTPTPRWSWDFGDGGRLDVAIPGSTYPDLTVSHVYRTGGSREVKVTTTWTATVMIDGLGPFEVRGPVMQESATTLRVGQARAVLVP